MTGSHILRHADAGDPGAWRGEDAERPVSDKGRRQSERRGRFLAEIGFQPDVVVASPKLRAIETARMVGGLLGHPTEPRQDERLAEGFDLAAVASVLHDLRVERSVLVAHDPDLSELVGELCGTGAIPLRKPCGPRE